MYQETKIVQTNDQHIPDGKGATKVGGIKAVLWVPNPPSLCSQRDRNKNTNVLIVKIKQNKKCPIHQDEYVDVDVHKT